MSKNEKINLVLATALGLILGVAVVLGVQKLSSDNLVRSGNLGAPAGPAIENYDPAIRQNGGYVSDLGILTTSTLEAQGTITLGGSTSGRGTTTAQAVQVGGSSGLTTVVISGSFADATTTLFAIPDPFGNASSTADFAQIEITGAATSSAMSLTVATSSQNASFAPQGLAARTATTTSLLNAVPIMASTTGGFIVNTGPATTYNAWNAATTTDGIAAQSSIFITPNAILVGWLTPYGEYGSTLGATNGVNTFSGTYKIRYNR